MFRMVAQGQQSPVNFRMQRLQPAVHHFRKTGIVRNIRYFEAAIPNLRRRSPGGENFDIKIGQSFGKRGDAGLVGDADQNPRDLVQSHASLLCIVFFFRFFP